MIQRISRVRSPRATLLAFVLMVVFMVLFGFMNDSRVVPEIVDAEPKDTLPVVFQIRFLPHNP